MGWILLAIFVGVPALIIGGAFISVKKEQLEEKANKYKRDKKIYDALIQKDIVIDEQDKNFKFSIKDMPQITFERFLNLYNSCPEKWHIDRNQYDHEYTCIPYYVTCETHSDKKGHTHKNFVCIPVFWASVDDMMKYDAWADHEYIEGRTSGYERKRDAQLELLANYLQKDIEQRRKELLKEYEQIVDESAQVKVDNTDIMLDLNAYQKQAAKSNEGFETLVQ